MSEVLRLQIIYETERAASSLARLNPIQKQTHSGLRNIESGMKSLAVSALGVPGPVGKVAEGLLKFGTGGIVTLTVVAGIGLIATAYQKATDDTNRFLKASEDLDKKLSAFGGRRVQLVDQLNDATEALAKLRKEAVALAPGTGGQSLGRGGMEGFWTRFKAGPARPAEFIEAMAAITKNEQLIKTITDEINASLREQTAERQKQLEIAQKEAFLLQGEDDVLTHRAIVNLSRRGDTVNVFDRMRLGGNLPGPRSLDLGFGQRPDTTLSGGLEHKFGQGVGLGTGGMDEQLTNRLTRQQERIVESWSAGLHTMQDAVEEFLVTGKFAINELINEFLRIAFRAATDGLIETATNKVIDKIQHSNNAKRLMGIKT